MPELVSTDQIRAPDADIARSPEPEQPELPPLDAGPSMWKRCRQGDGEVVLKVCPIALSLISVVVAVGSAMFTVRVNRSMKTLDLVSQCQQRFERLIFDIKPAVIKNKSDPRDYYERYWTLQLDQYQEWKKGFLYDDVYSFWMSRRQQEWENNEIINGVDYRTGWERFLVSYKLTDSDFRNFMEQVFAGKHAILNQRS